MNQRDINFLTIAFPQYYGRPQSTKIDIKQMSRFVQRNGIKDTNPFLAYAITEKSEEEKREDHASLHQLIARINHSILNKADGLAIEMILRTLDRDGDGYIGIEDVLAMNGQLGTLLTEQQIAAILQKITQQGTKISKAELSSIF